MRPTRKQIQMYKDGTDPKPGWNVCAECGHFFELEESSEEAILTGVCDICIGANNNPVEKLMKIGEILMQLRSIDNEGEQGVLTDTGLTLYKLEYIVQECSDAVDKMISIIVNN